MKDFRHGFNRVIEIVQAQHLERTGSEHGAITWLARQLGTSKQSVDNWRKRDGFPYRYARKLMRITGLSEAEIWPGGIAVSVDFPVELWNDVVKASGDFGRTAPETVVELVRIGLSKGKKHGAQEG